MQKLALLLFGLAGLVYFCGGFFLSSWRHDTRARRSLHAAAMGIVFAVNLLNGFDNLTTASSIALFAFLAQTLGLLGCVHLLVLPNTETVTHAVNDERVGTS